MDYDAPGLGGEPSKLILRPPEECDIENDVKEIEVDDLDMAEVLKLAQNEGLDPAAVEVGIRKEMKGLQDFGVYQEISEKEVKEQGLKVIDSRLVIKENADGLKARLCAKDFAHTKRDDLYAPTLSPAIVRTLLTRAHRRGWITNLIDFVQAFLHAPIDDDNSDTSTTTFRPTSRMALDTQESSVRTPDGATGVSRFARESASFHWVQADGWTSCVLSAQREGRRDCDTYRRWHHRAVSTGDRNKTNTSRKGGHEKT